MVKNLLITVALFAMGMFSVSAYDAKSPIPRDVNIVGHVTSNGQHLPFVNILIEGTTKGVTTDETGHYFIKGLNSGSYEIIATAIGYKSSSRKISIKEDTTTELNFDLTEDVIGIEQVVVTADRNEKKRRDATVVVSSISPKMFEVAQAVALSDGIKFSTGVRVENNCQNCGFTQVKMNGLSGPYTQILINSKPVFSGLAGVYGLEQMPANMIERVEIVRGGGSALYGGNAIAGTINIITKDPINNSFKISSNIDMVGVGTKADKVSPESNIMFNGTVVTNDQKAGLFLFGARRDRENFDINNDGYSEIADLKNSSVGFQAYYKPTELGKLSVEFHNINEYRRGGNKFDMLPHMSNITEMVKHDINSGGLQYDAFFSSERNTKISGYVSAEHIKRDSYYGAGFDVNAYGTTSNLTANSGLQFSTKFDKLLFAPAEFMMGVDNTYSGLVDEKLAGEVNRSNTTIVDQYMNTFGSFIQNQWNLHHIKFLLGLRVDNYKIDDRQSIAEKVSNTVIIPRANVLFDLTHSIQGRISYAKGYRAPQVFDEDLHILSNTAYSIIHVNDPNLVEEVSHSFSGSLDFAEEFGRWQTSFLVEGFYTKLIKPFKNEFSEAANGVMIATRRNATSDANVAGVNFEFKAAPSNMFSIQTGWTIQQSKYEVAEQWGSTDNEYTRDFLRSPNTYGYAVANFQVTKPFGFSLTANYTGSMLTPHMGLSSTTTNADELLAIANGDVISGNKLVKSPAFFDGSVKITYDFNVSKSLKMQLNAGVQNVFNSFQNDHDKGEYRDSGYSYGPIRPRTISFGIILGNII